MALFGRPTAKDDAKAKAYAQWVQQRNPLAIGSMVLGVFSMIEFGVLLVFGIGGIVLGVLALRQLARANAGEKPLLRAVEETRASAGLVPYEPGDSVPLPRALDYEAPPTNIAPVRGHRLAWGGIVLSAVSLIIAAILYLQRHRGS